MHIAAVVGNACSNIEDVLLSVLFPEQLLKGLVKLNYVMNIPTVGSDKALQNEITYIYDYHTNTDSDWVSSATSVYIHVHN